MRIGSEITKEICFFYATEEDAKSGDRPLGTGFFVWHADQDKRRTHVYIVTCDHVAQESAPLQMVRYNQPYDFERPVSRALSQHGWTSHPKGDDVAVCYLGLEGLIGPVFAGTSQFLTKDDLGVEVDHGDTCLMVGCFAPHPGKQRNIPVLRFGNLSMMPIEPIYIKERSFHQLAFLVEMRSRGGYSGSPVLLLPSPSDPDQRQLRKTLGVCCGHLLEKNPKSGLTEDSGMAMVIPAWKILEVLQMPELMEVRRQAERDFDRKHGRNEYGVSLAWLDAQREKGNV